MIKKRLIIIVFCVIFTNVKAQKQQLEYFIPPVNYKMYLSGTFAELRPNHFHSGIDVKTNNKSGIPLYAIADGYVSRIKVQEYGYGLALYITHPNSRVSVYAHLSKYNNTIAAYVKKLQYQNKSFELDYYPQPNELKVKKGEIIAYSGNTGRSSAPHLHFEIRDEESEQPLNPLSFYNITDNIKPIIKQLRVYSLGISAQGFIVRAPQSNPNIKHAGVIKTGENVYFGIEAYDKMNGSWNNCGVYSVEVYVDNELFYKHIMNRFSFDETRYINAFIDYEEYKNTHTRFQWTKVMPGNNLSIYEKVENNGILKLTDSNKHLISYVVSDYAGNATRLDFYIQRDRTTNKVKASDNYKQTFKWDQNNFYLENGFLWKMPLGSLYEDLEFEYYQKSSLKYLAKLHYVHNVYVPIHEYCEVFIKPDKGIDFKYRNKLCVVEIEKGKVYDCGGEWYKGYVKTEVRNFGVYTVLIDTIPPKIKPLNISNNKNIRAQKTIEFKVHDNLSGVEEYNAYINGEWVLMEYDGKYNHLIYRIDNHLRDGKNTFKLIVSDEKNNISEYNAVLYN